MGNRAGSALWTSVSRPIVRGDADRHPIQAGCPGPNGATQAVRLDPSNAAEARYPGVPSSRPAEENFVPPVMVPAMRSRAESGAVGDTVASPEKVQDRAAGGLIVRVIPASASCAGSASVGST